MTFRLEKEKRWQDIQVQAVKSVEGKGKNFFLKGVNVQAINVPLSGEAMLQGNMGKQDVAKVQGMDCA